LAASPARPARRLCECFVREEQEMANFLFEHLPEITRQYLRSRGS
jgi:hypothetical protein